MKTNKDIENIEMDTNKLVVKKKEKKENSPY